MRKRSDGHARNYDEVALRTRFPAYAVSFLPDRMINNGESSRNGLLREHERRQRGLQKVLESAAPMIINSGEKDCLMATERRLRLTAPTPSQHRSQNRGRAKSSRNAFWQGLQ
jgi:hypothetical protein